MVGEPKFVGIDVSKAQVDVAVRPTGKTWTLPYDQICLGDMDTCKIG